METRDNDTNRSSQEGNEFDTVVEGAEIVDYTGSIDDSCSHEEKEPTGPRDGRKCKEVVRLGEEIECNDEGYREEHLWQEGDTAQTRRISLMHLTIVGFVTASLSDAAGEDARYHHSRQGGT